MQCYEVRTMFADQPLLKMDRSATCKCPREMLIFNYLNICIDYLNCRFIWNLQLWCGY